VRGIIMMIIIKIFIGGSMYHVNMWFSGRSSRKYKVQNKNLEKKYEGSC
jgi:hypothetical protein